MPCTAIRDDDVDAVLTLHALAAAIVDLVKGEVVDVNPNPKIDQAARR